MPRWVFKDVFQSKVINKTIKLVIGYENSKYRQNPKIQLKSARRKSLSHLNRKLFSENFCYDPMNFFSQTMGTMNKRKFNKLSNGTKTTKKNPKTFLKKYEKACIEVKNQ